MKIQVITAVRTRVPTFTELARVRSHTVMTSAMITMTARSDQTEVDRSDDQRKPSAVPMVWRYA